MKLLRYILAVVLFCSVTWTAAIMADTVYVDGGAGNLGAPGQDGSAGNPWDTIQKGVESLSNLNAVVQGNHTVVVAVATYTGTVYLASAHSGVSGQNNVIEGVAGAELKTGGFRLDGSDYVTIDGFYLNSVNIYLNGSGVLVQNCDVVGASPAGVYVWTGGNDSIVRRCSARYSLDGIYSRAANLRVENCVLMFNYYTGFHSYAGSSDIRNCILASNGKFGMQRSYGSGMTGAYNCVYANGIGNVFAKDLDRIFDTAAEINSLNGTTTCSNNIVANPCFSALSSNWNFNEFFTNSPCLDAGDGGVDIGRYENPPTVDTSDKTYYVDITTGNDARNTVEAQNQATPWQTISKAAAFARAGDSVIVGPGTYPEIVTITNTGCAGFPVTYTANGSVLVTNGAGGGIGAFHLDRVSKVVLDGFECPGAWGYFVCGMSMTYSFDNTIRNGICHNYDSGFLAWFASGILCRYASCHNTIQNMVFYANTYGVHQYYYSANIFDKCNVYSNYVGIDNLNAAVRSVRNCIVRDNRNTGIHLDQASSSYTSNRVENCVIVNNVTNGIVVANNASAEIENTVIAGSGTGIREVAAANDAAAMYCCFDSNGTNFLDEGSTPLQTPAEINALPRCYSNIVADPLFKTPVDNNYRLKGGSPCIDAGSPTTDLSTDYFGQPRLVGPAVDMGIYEMPPGGSVFVFR